MTLQLVDEIQALADCRTDQERALWLLTCPLSKLLKYEVTIRSRLQNAGFLDGVKYLDEELPSIRAPRRLGRRTLKNDYTWLMIEMAKPLLSD